MAIIENNLLKGVRGKLKDVVLYQFRGKTCLRAKPEKENITFSEGMVQQQERIAGVAALYQAVKASGMYPVWKQAAVGKRLSGYNLFVQRNNPAFTGEGNIGDFNKVHLSVGTLQLPDQLKLVAGAEGEWILEWSNITKYPGTHDDDRLIVALLKQEKGFLVRIPDIGDYRRKHCRAVIRLPPRESEEMHLYVYLCSPEGKEFSDNFYFIIH